MVRRAEKARRRKQLTIAGSVLGVVIVVAAGVGIYYLTNGDDGAKSSAAAPTSADPSLSSTPQAAPPPAPKPLAATVSCNYRDGGQSAKPGTHKPDKTQVSTAGATKVQIQTSQGPIGLNLNQAESPCTVNSFVNLAQQKFYDGAPCHRLSTEGLKMLQCGDPTGSGQGGPGYEFDNEYPTDQYPKGDPNAQNPVEYKRGVIAMANAGADPQSGNGTNGSQFFLMFGDSQLPPQYTIFGTIDNPGLATLDKIAKAGDDHSMDSSAGGGKPNVPVNFKSVTVS
jgi:peptidyl-prolyl cis-trans isomerase B (cyclophilin B)